MILVVLLGFVKLNLNAMCKLSDNYFTIFFKPLKLLKILLLTTNSILVTKVSNLLFLIYMFFIKSIKLEKPAMFYKYCNKHNSKTLCYLCFSF